MGVGAPKKRGVAKISGFEFQYLHPTPLVILNELSLSTVPKNSNLPWVTAWTPNSSLVLKSSTYKDIPDQTTNYLLKFVRVDSAPLKV